MNWADMGIEEDGTEQRLITVLDGGIPDRVPYWEYWCNSPTVQRAVLGRPVETLRDSFEFCLRTGQDVVGVGFGWRPGCVYGTASDGSYHYLDGSIRTWEDVRSLEPPDVSADLARLEEMLEIAADSTLGVYAMVSSIFDGTYLAMGLETFSIALYEDRPLVEALMDTLTDFFRGLMEKLAEYDEVRIVQINDDIARKGGLWIRPELFREMFVPRMRHILEPLHAARKRLTFHTDGTLDEVIPVLVELGFRAVHPCEYAANDIRDLKNKFGGKICLHGNVPTTLLAHGTPEQVGEHVRQLIEDMKPGGRYILSSTTSIFEGVKPENFAAMIRAVQRFGRYNALKGKDAQRPQEE
ncbi:MAG: hypothetical protein H5T86_04890 [Armatimonadetes bacterium]|nr:hypothetical protein [Armatimonadota bacterium]